MDKKYIKNYWKEVRRRAWKSASDRAGIKLLISTLIILLFASAIAGFVFVLGKVEYPFFRDNLVANSITGLSQMIFSIFALLGLFVWLMYRTPPEMEKEKEKEIDVLNERLSLKEYDDISIERFKSPETIGEKSARLGLSYTSEIKKLEFLVINNGNIGILNASVSMTELKWFNPEYNNIPDGIETRAFIWDDIETSDGKRNISPKGRGHLKIAIYQSHPMSLFRFVFYDCISQVIRILQGKYVIKLQLDGQVRKKNIVEDLLPVPFELSFDFEHRGFQNITISKLPRE